MEYRDTDVATPYQIKKGDNTLKLPKNLFILGTMNTADKSIGTIDYAIRRRFLFFPTLPDIRIVCDSVGKANISSANEVKLFYLIDNIFEYFLNSDDYSKEDVQIGHTYFIRKDNLNTEEKIKYRILYQVIPILKEYCKDGILNFDRSTDDSINNIKDSIDIFKKMAKEANDNSANYDELIKSVNTKEYNSALESYLKTIHVL